ncbi:MAG: adenylate/guanylate cyclase domain-containing protein, partial [Microthrixaceae bacterium]
MGVPDTRYATSDGLKLAYQAFGDGPPMILVPPLVSHVEIVWEHELNRRILEFEAQYLRIIQFDKRGIGGSDAFDEFPTLEQRIADITAVMDAEGLERAHLMGLSEGGLMAQHFAIRYPERVDRLVLVNTMRSVEPDELAPFGEVPDVARTVRSFGRLVETWGVDPSFMVEWMMPSQRDNAGFIRWAGRYQRLSASPAGIERQIASVLPLFGSTTNGAITAPTLVMHATGDRVIPVSGGRQLAASIPGAQLVEFDMDDHFIWVNDGWRDLAAVLIPFLTDAHAGATAERRFGALLFTDLVDSTARASAMGDDRWRDAIASHDRITEAVVAGIGGRVVKRMGDGLVALFDTPSMALDAAASARSELAAVGLTIRGGVHAGEFEVLDDGDVRGLAVHLAACVQAVASPGEVLVTSTV